MKLARAIAGRDDSAIFRGSAEPIEHAPRVERDFADSFFAVALVAKK